MRWIALALIIALALGCAQGSPLQGSNGVANCTVFGAYRSSPSSEGAEASINASEFMILTADIGLMGAYNATYALVDSKDQIYQQDDALSKDLQPGRRLVKFVVPTDGLFKLLRISPDQGDAFAINWWATPKAANGPVIMRYYGICDYYISADNKSMALQVKVSNNGTEDLYLSPENFTLFDQNGWEYYTLYGFDPISLGSQKTAQFGLFFNDLSPWSDPTLLVYDYLGKYPIAIDIENDLAPLSDAQVYGSSSAQATEAKSKAAASTTPPAAQATEEASEATEPAAEQTSAEAPAVEDTQDESATPSLQSKGSGDLAHNQDDLNKQLEEVRSKVASTGGESATTGDSKNVSKAINSTVVDTKDRLAKVREKLKGQNS
jgi:hypothetical protein